MGQTGFMDAVVTNVDAWKAHTGSVIEAVKRNAENPEHKNQLTWVVAFLAIVKHPAVDELSRLLDD